MPERCCVNKIRELPSHRKGSVLLRKHKTKRQERKASKKLSQSKQALKMVVEDALKTSASEDQAKTETNPKPREEDDEPEEGEIVGDEESASKPSKGIAPQSHALEHSWTFWFDSPAAKSAKTKQEDWGSSIRPIYTFSTVEEFWRSHFFFNFSFIMFVFVISLNFLFSLFKFVWLARFNLFRFVCVGCSL